MLDEDEFLSPSAALEPEEAAARTASGNLPLSRGFMIGMAGDILSSMNY